MSCEKCKKKKLVKKLDPIIEDKIKVFSKEDIKLAYAELTSYGGVKSDKREFIKEVYKFIFNEELNLDCGGCASNQVRKFTFFMKNL
jgi:hypothetical protein